MEPTDRDRPKERQPLGTGPMERKDEESDEEKGAETERESERLVREARAREAHRPDIYPPPHER